MDPSMTTTATQPAKAERVAKLIARAGVCSRREAEKLIAERRVAVDGTVLETPAVTVDDPGRITVDGERLPRAERARLFRYHKPRGLVTTNRDPQGRPTIFEALPPGLPRLVTVGRLDLTSEGLLLLTNDGALARHLELPATGWSRRYRVRVNGKADAAKLAALAGGITVDGVRYGPIEARLDRQQGANAWLTVALREGKNREVRRVLEHLGYPVSRLIRVAYGPFQLGGLADGAVEEVPEKVLREQLGAGFAPNTPPRPNAHRRRHA
jgi:23S rRNA pseudouridine2605 synthase